ncbi:MAG: [NiFe]-hydrogenase assembly chaperone HybE [Candidatus Thiodiazotropha weberae]|nr:[NiFe]-hydrogenase assembly chaperone HybE [Candidatus Thiodiazotropha weberae]
MICPDYIIEGLEVQFRSIEQQRMQGLPLLNPALQVEAVGFRQWQDLCLGVLITPWFMNLMLIPHEGDSWREKRIGDKQTHLFPSGPYDFILGEEEGIGRYQMCSLFSPMFEFSDQQTAVTTATQVMLAIMDEENQDGLSTCESEINRRRHGEAEEDETTTDESSEPERSVAISERLQQPVSRRDLLRGTIHQDGEQ